MRNSRIVKPFIAVWLSLALVFSMVQSVVVYAAESQVLPNGEYDVDFNILEDGKSSVSTANLYMKIPGTKAKIIADNGTYWLEHEILSSELTRFLYLGYRPDGVPKAIIVNSVVQDKTGIVDVEVRESANADRKILKYRIYNIESPQDILMHIYIPEMIPVYDHWYHAQLWFDTTVLPLTDDEGEEPGGENPGTEPELVSLELLNDLIQEAKSVLSTSVEGSDYGQFPTGSKQNLDAAVFNAEVRLSMTLEDDEEEYALIYESLDEALQYFISLEKKANKGLLIQLISTMKQFLSTAKVNGQTNGLPGGANAAIVDGEYFHSAVQFLTDRVNLAEQIVAKGTATQEEVDTQINLLKNRYIDVKNQQYVSNVPLKLYVLDTNQTTATESVYSDKLSSAVSTITQISRYDSWGDIKANITLNETPDDNKVYWFNPAGDGTYYSPDLYESMNFLFAVTKTPNVALGSNIFQGDIKYLDANKETQWTGLGHLTYRVGGVKRSLYLSFNRDIHEQLKQLLMDEKKNVMAAKQTNIDQVDYDDAKEELLAVMDAVEPITENLNATRPDIINALEQLGAAAESYRTVAQVEYELYYGMLHATNNAFSSADKYLAKPAKVLPLEDGTFEVTLTINESSVIRNLQIERNEVFTEVEPVSSNTSNDTRTVRFIVNDLSQLMKAKIRAVTNLPNGGVYDMTHDIRLNFNGVNNAELQAKITEASNLNRAAVVGTAVGQYSATSKTALQTAIAAAGAVAVNGPNTDTQSEEALAALLVAIQAFKDSVVTLNDLQDGDYSIAFSILKGNVDEASMVNSYAVSPARLQIKDGEKRIYFTLKQSAQIPQLKVNGEDVSISGTNTSANSREVNFLVADLTQDVPGWAKFNWTAQNNTGEYDLRFRFASTVTPYVETETPGPGTGPITGDPGSGNPVYPQDGYYYMSFRVLKDGTDDSSIANSYVVSPALVKVQGSSRTVSFVVLRSKEVHTVTINGSSGFDVQTNASANLRAVSYSLSSLSGKQNGTVGIHWPEFNYNNKQYDIQFQFDESSATYAGANPTVMGYEQDGNVGAPGLELPPEGGTTENPEEPSEPVDDGNSPSISFSDTDKHWAANEIKRAVELGITNGFSDGTFRPEQEVTRGEFAAFLSRALGLGGDTSEMIFEDGDQIPAWAREHAVLAAQAGFISGFEDGTFRSNTTITRAQLAVILARAAGLELAEDAEPSFADAKDIPSWARREIAAVEAAELMQGTGNHQFDPNGPATRAQALTILLRLLDYLDGAEEQLENQPAESSEVEEQ
ncbi:NEAT domain-containing protein [Paenibacillus sp. strain BS8-2]